MHSCAHKAVEGDHVTADVEEGVVGEGGEDHGQAGGASSRVAGEPLDHGGLKARHPPGSKHQQVQTSDRPEQFLTIRLKIEEEQSIGFFFYETFSLQKMEEKP